MKTLPTARVNDLLNFLAPRPFNEVAQYMNALVDAVDNEEENSPIPDDVLNGLLGYMNQLPYAQVSEGIQWVTDALAQTPKATKARKKKN